jgi:hypothetical protein
VEEKWLSTSNVTPLHKAGAPRRQHVTRVTGDCVSPQGAYEAARSYIY